MPGPFDSPDAELLAHHRVLLLEPDLHARFLTENMVAKLGAAGFWSVSDIGGALAAINEARPDVAILDMLLGGDMIQPITERLDHHGAPFIVTGRDLRSLPPGWRGLRKPFSLSELRAVLAEALDR